MIQISPDNSHLSNFTIHEPELTSAKDTRSTQTRKSSPCLSPNSFANVSISWCVGWSTPEGWTKFPVECYRKTKFERREKPK